MPKLEIVESANSVDLDEAAHNELPHLCLHCFPQVFEFVMNSTLDKTFFFEI